MRTLSKFIKKNFDIFGGVFFGILSSIIVKWQVEKLQLIYTIIILILVWIGLMKILTHKQTSSQANKKDELLIDKFVKVQKPLKAIELSQNPTKDGEELGKILVNSMKGWKKRMKKIKNFFKWIWTYRQQLVGLLGAFLYVTGLLYVLIVDKFQFVLKYVPETLGWRIATITIIAFFALIFAYYIVRNQVKRCGMGGLEYATQYLKEVGKEINNSLSTKAQEYVKEKVAQLKEAKKVLSEQYDQVLVQFKICKEQLNAMKELIEYGTGDQLAFSEKQKEFTALNIQVTELERAIAVKDQEIKDQEKVLYK